MTAPGFPVAGRLGSWLPWRTGLLTLVALAAAVVLDPAPSAWVFDAGRIAQGEWWRLVTGHWVHSDLEHAAWNIGALAVLGALFERRLGNGVLLALAAGTLGVDAWLLTSPAAPYAYCGLSGILNALLAAGLVALGRERPHPVVVLTGVGAAAKILVEMALGGALITDAAWPSVPQAHAIGFVCGLSWALPGAAIFSRPGKRLSPPLARPKRLAASRSRSLRQTARGSGG